MTSQSRRSFLKNTALVPMLSPVFLLGSLSKAYAPSQNSLPQWISKARSDIPATKNPFFQTAGIGPSPRSLLASSKDLSIFSRETKIGRIAKGAQPCVSAIITAFELYKIKVRGSVIISSQSRNEFRTPLYPRMTFHKNILSR